MKKIQLNYEKKQVIVNKDVSLLKINKYLKMIKKVIPDWKHWKLVSNHVHNYSTEYLFGCTKTPLEKPCCNEQNPSSYIPIKPK